jgi:hypothetical protein
VESVEVVARQVGVQGRLQIVKRGKEALPELWLIKLPSDCALKAIAKRCQYQECGCNDEEYSFKNVEEIRIEIAQRTAKKIKR